jgi:hypothetical protein
MQPPTDKEMEELPHIILTSACDCEPSSLNNNIDPTSDNWYETDSFIDPYSPHHFTLVETYKHREFNTLITCQDISVHNTSTQHNTRL